MPDTDNKLTQVDTSLYPKFNALTGMGQQQQTNPLAQVSQTLGVAQQAQGLQQQQAQLGMQRLNYMHGQFGAVASDPNPTFDKVANIGANLVRNGIAPASEVAAQLTDIPRDPEGIRAWAQQHQMNVADHAQRWAATYGVPSTINVNDKVFSGNVDQRTGAFTPAGAPQSMGMSPEAAGQPRPYMDPRTGQSFTVPASSLLSRTGRALPGPVSAPTNSDPNAPASSSMRPAGMPPQAGPQPQPQPQAGAAPAGALPQSLPAGQNQMIEASTGRLASDLDSARNLQSDLVPLQNARAAITNLGPNGTGPGTQDRQKVASALQSAGLGWLPGVDSDRIENMDEASKYLTQAMQSRAANMKAGTDAQQATTAAGSPNLKMSSAAALNVLNALEGQRRMQQAQTFSVPHDQNYLSNTAKWASSQDPRAYYFDRMTDDQKAKTMASLGGQNTVAYKRFVASLRSAHDTGLMETGQ